MTKNNIEIVDRIDHPDHVTFKTRLHIDEEVFDEEISMKWSEMKIGDDGKPRYIHNLKQYALQMIAVKRDETIKKNTPKPGDIIEVD